MLILTRNVSESIRIGDDVTITLIGVRGKQARFGIDAPRGIPVHREEIYVKLQQKKAEKPSELENADSA